MIDECSILNGAKYSSEKDGSQSYFVFQPVKYFKILTNDIVRALKSKGLSDESVKLHAASANSLNPRLDYINKHKFQVEFNGCCLKPDRVSFPSKKVINLFLTLEIKS